jgi:diguanylate cyclase (GGDEF)-like protein
VASVVAWRLNEEQAFKDSLTGLPNRRLFRDRVGHALARAGRRPGTCAVLFIDLDKFKDVNDSLGHPAGDHLLTSVAHRLRGVVRTGDTVARLGGDEFAVLAEDVVGETDAVALARRVLDALAAPFPVRTKELTVGASVGVALSLPGDTVDVLLRNADVAMYNAKNAGRGCCRLFEDDMHAAVVRRVELENSLRRAGDDGQFELYYQPIFALATGRLTGFEALLRWNHPARGLLAPPEFLALAEETGAIVGIGAWALNEACRQTRQWNDRHPNQPLGVTVNLSPHQLYQPDVVEVVAEAVRSSGLDPAGLTLELTEGVFLDDGPTVITCLRNLKQLGVQLAIDDFGTGYSSLSYLRRLPIDILKIDKIFIDDVARGAAESAVVRAIIKLAQTLELTIVAEGVEAEEQATRLRQLGCHAAQGYWFAKPLNVDAINAILRVADGADQWLTSDQLRPAAATLSTGS